MKTTLFLIVTLTVMSLPLSGQSLKNPWSVLDGGGGKSAGAGLNITASVGQPAVQKMTYIDTGMILESGFIPGLRSYSGAWMTGVLSLQPGWNLVSVPLLSPDMRRTALYPDAVSDAFSYGPGGYFEVDTLNPGYSYWLKFLSAQSYEVSGTQVSVDTVQVLLGWNMIGSLAYPMLASSVVPVHPVGITSSFFAYGIAGYFEEDTLKPGVGYWVKANQAGKIVLNNNVPVFARSSVAPYAKKDPGGDGAEYIAGKPSEFSTISFKDNKGDVRSIYYSRNTGDIDLDKYELPPVPPGEMLDVRYASQRYLEVVSPEKGGRFEFPLRINGCEFPLKIDWNPARPGNETVFLEIQYGGKTVKKYPFAGSGSLTIGDDNFIGAKLIIQSNSPSALPTEFALHQNYPNPFNPSTKIRYDLPKDTRVRLKIYDILGREAASLIDGVEEAGYREIEWNANVSPRGGLSSGTYFYRLEAGDYISVKKLTLLK